ncbi:MAG: tetratricopeptide repeat protein [Pirellulales bacterium]|nr:tetratricopeptide repeat protein [Thermoguttaceae bacterium]MDD4786425.1 tetratricopeptide repeat protein [Pirellulales bacterium]MDI9445595.1 tetratricopeptide repeat protein [Planctomycetota bacterium]NLZ02167.1 tetratricopeptide repeat protein [Pirellulaceae bacterium]
MPFRFSWYSPLLIALSLLPASGWTPAGASPPGAEPGDAPAAGDPLDAFPFEEPCARFIPQRPPSEAEQDRVEALALFSLAHELEDRGDRAWRSGKTDLARPLYDKALRAYQRTLRFDSAAEDAARAVVRLSARLKRPAMAEYAARRMRPANRADAALLRFMAMHLASEGQGPGAVALYERLVAADPPAVLPAGDEVILWLEIGRLCHLNEEYEKAAGYLARVVEALAEPDKFQLSPEARKALLEKEAAVCQLIGSCFLSAGRTDEAKRAFDQSQRAAPQPRRAALNEARLHQSAGRLEDALAALKVYFHERPEEDGLAGCLLLEEILGKLGRQEQLIEYLEGLHQQQPENTAARYFLAEKYAAANQPEKAERLYRGLVEDAPTLTVYRRLLEIHLGRGDDPAIADVLAAVVEKAGSLDPLGEGLQRLAASESTVSAILATAGTSLSEEPLAAAALLAAAQLGLAAGRFDDVPPLFQAAFRLAPERAASGLLDWGVALLEAEKYAESADVFRQAAELPGVEGQRAAVFQYYLAAALEMAGKTDEALAAARAAIRLDEDSAVFHSRVAWILYHADRKPEAAAAYRALVDRFDDQHGSPQVRRIVRQSRMILSNLCLEERRIPDAVEWLQQVLDEFPEDPGALNDLGYLWADENMHLHRARRMIERAVEAEPDNGAFRDSLGWVLFRQGQYERAVAELEKAAEFEPDPVVLDHLGEAYARCKQNDKAAAAWRRSYERFKQAGDEQAAERVRDKLEKTK